MPPSCDASSSTCSVRGGSSTSGRPVGTLVRCLTVIPRDSAQADWVSPLPPVLVRELRSRAKVKWSDTSGWDGVGVWIGLESCLAGLLLICANVGGRGVLEGRD